MSKTKLKTIEEKARLMAMHFVGKMNVGSTEREAMQIGFFHGVLRGHAMALRKKS